MTLIPLVLTAGAVAALTAVAVGAGGPPAPGAGAAPGSVARVGAPLVPVAGPALPGGGGPPTRPVLAAASFRWPLAPAPAVLRRFVVGPQPWSPGHRGVDLAATVGEQVLSAGAGVVAFAGLVAGRGVVSIVHTGGLRTTYEPVTAQVRAGETVTAGTVLGRL
ncbi:MAG TPA: M23 family metallopeptidase, partial [Kineosporiaceae bacterium]|nr:M23 family metallopeptidase [Kineosporiaceae bacterium]